MLVLESIFFMGNLDVNSAEKPIKIAYKRPNKIVLL